MWVKSHRHSEWRSPAGHILLLLLALLVCSLTGILPAAQAQLGVTSIGWRPLGLASAPGRVVAMTADPRNNSILFLAAPSG